MWKWRNGKRAILLTLFGLILPVFLASCGGSGDSAPAPPTAAFSATPISGTAPMSVNFTDESTGGATSWAWDFGDGAVSTEQNPSHIYSTAGTYTVALTATGAGGSNTNTKTEMIAIGAAPVPPVAAFTATPATGVAPLVVNFADQSTGSTTSWSWDFGDGATSTLENPSHVYAAAGTYTVALTATGPGGSNTNTQANLITVGSPPVPPVAAFTATPTNGPLPLTVNFSNQTTGSATSWSWNFGDGGTSTSQNPSHNYAAGGTYTVSLTATGPGGSDPETKVGYINVTPLAEFVAAPLTGTAPVTVAFTDQSTGGATSWFWDFGDETTSTLQNPSHDYTDVLGGNYTVALTATGPGGANTKTRLNYINTLAVPAPVAAFTGTPTTGAASLGVTFTDQSTGVISTWAWDFGDGGTSALQNPTHNYFTSGIYTVSLTATGPGGSDPETKVGYVTVTPLAEFLGDPLTGTSPLTVQFTNQSTGGDTSWSWDFGDGGTSTLQNPSHAYTDVLGGNFNVSLIATGPGGSNTKTRPNYISTAAVPAPVAAFSGTPLSGTVPLSVAFTDASTGTISSWSWNFGDGEASTLQNPTHNYVASGTYTVALTVTGPGGSDPETKVGYITANPAVFTDSFNRANENPLAGNWTTAPGCGDLQLLTNQVIPVVESVISCAYWNANSFNPDQYSQLRLAAFRANVGPAVRIQTGGVSRNGYFAKIDSVNQISLMSNVNGSASVIPPSYTGLLLQANDVIKLQITGNTLELFINGVSQGTRTNSQFSSGVPGVWTFFLNGPLDDWEGGSLN